VARARRRARPARYRRGLTRAKVLALTPRSLESHFTRIEGPPGDQLMNDKTSKKIIGLGGSLRVSSYSSAALRAGMDIAKGMGVSAELLDLRLLDLPMYVPDLPIEEYPASSREAVRKLVASFAAQT